MSSAYLRLLIFLPVILILACASSNPAFPAKQDNIQAPSWSVISMYLEALEKQERTEAPTVVQAAAQDKAYSRNHECYVMLMI